MALHRVVALALALLVSTPFMAIAQTPTPPASPTPASTSGDQLLRPEQLDALVAPIALYPDTLLSLVLMASTYPLEVVQADRWVREHKNLKGEQLRAEVDKQSWDESVKSLVGTPDVLSLMSKRLDWTMKLGDAVLAQQPDVMDAIQRLRTKADANNKLTTTKQQTVTKRQEQGRQVIYIEPTDPETIYVPYYDPAVVYGAWPYAEYPPYYWGYPGYIGAGLIGAGLAFGAGWALGNWASGGNYWGGGINWNNNNININRPRVNPLGGNNWQHRPEHRQGVRYNNNNVRSEIRRQSRRRVESDGFPRSRWPAGSAPWRRAARRRTEAGCGATALRWTTKRRTTAVGRQAKRKTAFGRKACGTAAFRRTRRRQRPWKYRVR